MNIDLYRKLFVHRGDVFAEQHEDGHYEPVKRPLTDDDIAAHLEGFVSYGVYVIKPMDTEQYGNGVVSGNDGHVDPPQSVSYVLFDLDTYDADALDFLVRAVERLVHGAHALAQTTTAKAMQYRCLILEDSGGKGYHVWLLLSEPVPAAQARAWAESIRAQYIAVANTVAPGADKWPALEIFPKQDTVPEGGYGNLVKLPFGVHAKTHTQALLKLREGWASSLEDVQPMPVSIIPAQRVTASEQRAPERNGRAPFACISKLLEDGAPDGCRDKAMYHFARYALGTGLPADMVQSWAERVNDLFDPPMEPSEVRKKVRSATTATAPHPGCSADWLEDFCPGGAHCFAPWNDRKNASEDDEGDTSAYPAQMSADERRAWRQRNAGGTD